MTQVTVVFARMLELPQCGLVTQEAYTALVMCKNIEVQLLLLLLFLLLLLLLLLFLLLLLLLLLLLFLLLLLLLLLLLQVLDILGTSLHLHGIARVVDQLPKLRHLSCSFSLCSVLEVVSSGTRQKNQEKHESIKNQHMFHRSEFSFRDI